jgi:hypothetical protein
VDGRNIVEADDEQHGNGDCPDTVKAISHAKIILPAQQKKRCILSKL